jgi:hypothetical protein
MTQQISQGDSLVSEENFFKWAIQQLCRLDEIIIVSHTPILFYKEEQLGVAKEYHKALEQRLSSQILNTTYFMNHDNLNKYIMEKSAQDERIKLLRHWDDIWREKTNIKARVVKKGYFPLVSFWIGKQQNNTIYTMIKLAFEDPRRISPSWLGISGEVIGLKNIILKLLNNSLSFEEYIEKMIRVVDSIEDP